MQQPVYNGQQQQMMMPPSIYGAYPSVNGFPGQTANKPLLGNGNQAPQSSVNQGSMEPVSGMSGRLMHAGNQQQQQQQASGQRSVEAGSEFRGLDSLPFFRRR